MLRQFGFVLGGSGLLTGGLLGAVLEMEIIGGLLLSIGVIDSGISVYDFLRRSAKILEKPQVSVEV
jgi:hypothetical protein